MVFDLTVEEIVTLLAPRILDRDKGFWYGPSLARMRVTDAETLRIVLAPAPPKAVAK